MNYVIWKGKDSREIKGLVICELPSIVKPQMRISETVIDGVDGSIIEELGYSSYDKALTIGITQKADMDEITKYFTGSGEIIFSNEPFRYYKATIVNQVDYARLCRFKTATVTIRVQPYKYTTVEDAVKKGTVTEVFHNLITNGVYADGEAVETVDEGENWEVITRFIKAKGNQLYKLSGTLTNVGWQISVYFYDEDKAQIKEQLVDNVGNTFTFTTTAETKYIKFDGYTPVIDIPSISLNEPSKDTTYTVVNEGTEPSKPLIVLNGNGYIECYVNGKSTFSYTFPSNEATVYIDSDKQDAFYNNTLKNRNMNGDFPVLRSGTNRISFSGDIVSAEIRARSRWV